MQVKFRMTHNSLNVHLNGKPRTFQKEDEKNEEKIFMFFCLLIITLFI